MGSHLLFDVANLCWQSQPGFPGIPFSFLMFLIKPQSGVKASQGVGTGKRNSDPPPTHISGQRVRPLIVRAIGVHQGYMPESDR